MIIEENFHHTITIGRNQCSIRNQQLLLYIRGESET